MTVFINRIVGGVLSPLGLGMLFMLLALVFRLFKRRNWAWGAVTVAFVWIWFFSTPLATRMLGCVLEGAFLVEGRVPTAESLPSADAIVLLGGGMGLNERLGETPEMWTSADRVWFAARLYRAGKAPRIVATGGGVDASTRPLLADFGVPSDALVFGEEPRNTEEEAKALQVLGYKRILLVTSAWHMRRALLMFSKYAPQIEVVPAPTDFEAQTLLGGERWRFSDFCPTADSLAGNSAAFKEIVAYVGYVLLR